MKKQELLARIKEQDSVIGNLLTNLDALSRKVEAMDEILMDLRSHYYKKLRDGLQENQPEDGADLNSQLIPWDYQTWKENPECWQPVTRDGMEVKQLWEFDLCNDEYYSLVGVLDGRLETFANNGSYYRTSISTDDITHMRRLQI